MAIDAATGKELWKTKVGDYKGEFMTAKTNVWRVAENFPVWSGALVTAGDVAFYGTMEGWFKAVHARTGKLLWQFKTSSGIIGQPVTYRGPDGNSTWPSFPGAAAGPWPSSPECWMCEILRQLSALLMRSRIRQEGRGIAAARLMRIAIRKFRVIELLRFECTLHVHLHNACEEFSYL